MNTHRKEDQNAKTYFPGTSYTLLLLGLFYSQRNGIAIGICLSPTIATLVIDSLLDNVLSKFNFKCTFVKKYVDDVFLSIPEDKTDELLKTFNEYNHHLQFTIEVE